MPRPYLLEVFSQPSQVSEDIWTKWYLEEHIRDMVYFKASRTGALYRSSSEIIQSGNVPTDGSENMKYLALYQTDRKHCLDFSEFKDHVRKKSKLWDERLISFDVGDFVPRESALIEILGSYEHIEGMENSLSGFT